MIRRPPRSTLDRSSAASDVYKRQGDEDADVLVALLSDVLLERLHVSDGVEAGAGDDLSLIHISEPTRPY